MFEDCLVVIPARGGSKRIPHKNIKLIAGWPMISWPLRVLSGLFKAEQVLISTDDDAIAEVVNRYRLNVPFKRPAELSDDYTGTMEVARHALRSHESKNASPDYVLIVYPTAVTLNVHDIKVAFDLIKADADCDYVFSATAFPSPIQRAFYEKSGYATMFNPEHYSSRSQDLTPAYHDAGQFYLCKAEVVRQAKNLTNANAKIVKLERKNVIDIDTLEDFEMAELILQLRKYNEITDAVRFESAS